eukprot:2824578-Heterocapsa_arctica.AAC.1
MMGSVLVYATISLLMLLRILVLIKLLGMGLETHSRFWWFAWSSLGIWLLIVAAFPRLHNTRGLPLSYVVFVLIACAMVAPMDGISKQSSIMLNAPIMMAMTMMSPVAGLSLST